MKKAFSVVLLVVLAVASLGQWPAPSDLIAFTGLTNRVELEWTAPPPIYDADTLAYDSGVAGGFGDLDSGYYSVRFSPAGRCSVVAIQAHFWMVLGPRPVRIHYWGVDGFGYPNIHDNLFSPKDVSVDIGPNEIDVSGDSIVVDGVTDFYIGISKRDTMPEIGVSYDDTVAGDVRSFRTDLFYGGHHPTPGDLLVRIVVMYLDRREMATLYGRVEKIITPVIPFPEPTDFLPYNAIPERFRMRPWAPSLVTTPESYTVYKSSTFGGAFSPLPSVPGSVTAYTDSSVTPGHTYYYAVKADYAGGSSPMPDTVWATTYSGTGTTIYDTLLHDDGVPDGGACFIGAVLVNKFHIDTRCKLIRLDYHIRDFGNAIPRIYLDDHGEPGTEILNYEVAYPFDLPIGWKHVNIEPWNIYVEGDFYIGLEMVSGPDISFDVGHPGYAWDLPPGGSWGEIADTSYFIRALIQYSDGSAYYHFYQGWNAISLPVIPDIGLNASDVFPFALGGQIYGWDVSIAGWELATTLEPGRGYFLLSDVDTFVSFDGVPIHDYTIPYTGPGFDFIGGLSDFGGADTTHVTTYPDPDSMWSPRHLFYWDAGGHTWAVKYKLMPSDAYFILLGEFGVFEVHE